MPNLTAMETVKLLIQRMILYVVISFSRPILVTGKILNNLIFEQYGTEGDLLKIPDIFMLLDTTEMYGLVTLIKYRWE